MQKERKQVKSMSNHGFSQFELTDKLLKNVYKLGLKGVTKDVLIQLSTFYNPKNRTMFPKQKTLAQRVNASERSVIRAVQSLVKAGLILVECKYTNHYIFTSKLLTELGLCEKFFTSENMSDDLGQNDTLKGDNLSPHDIEQISEQEKIKNKCVVKKFPEKKVCSDEQILLDYAKKMGIAEDKRAGYVIGIKQRGGDAKIIEEYKVKRAADRFYENQIHETLERNQEVRNFEGIDPKSNQAMQEVLKKLRR